MAKRSFEQMIDELEEIMRQLEQGDLVLDEMLKLYSKGVKLVDSCQARLDAAQAEITKKAAEDA